ncbi:LOW QUALITY PROTEIN: regulation of nuclear pre-mRNA domain-containing protein 1B-like [Dioscorea cayenensis subsp. rotundata]|uniref:LOW QUALITY PROTEIN: regulation of nuclear pre-mRNA domain-containing protein 1B-like n=1 Tax=Dioscorea cayennensis subsp. rotundata TaxID=55577 RepID=A0AB40AH90_DIOCR|nr:LOW QUALITY PROTEIN: regulation of nuclear pre-mRNA domain-containing protein 1B-like [Dioscorea cayenensis subsp. rotundata]
MNSAFNEQVLADKLAKLNSTQQCIETLSHWCIFHRKKAEQVVQTWDKAFHSSQKEQKIPLLYVANDILQNSKRNGTEFVGEFWKVLPGALKDVMENGDDRGKNVVSRLVGIWEERKVFGSYAKGLKDLMLGNEPPPALELNKKRSRSVRIMKRDSRSIKLKLSVGGMAEKIISALHSVQSEHSAEDSDLSKCKEAVRRVGKMEKDVTAACMQDGDPRRVRLTEELQEEEATLKTCIEKLKSFESNRVALISQLRAALQEQESELEIVRTQLQVAQAQVDEAANMRRRLNNEPIVETNSRGSSATEISKKTAAAIAAEVADKLAASSRSQQIMTSVLSTFAAEEAKNTAIASSSLSEVTHDRVNVNLEKPLPSSAAAPAFVSVPLQHQTVLVQQGPIQNQASTPQPPYNLYPASTQQYLQPTGGVMIGVPYTYSNLPPPPPPPQMLNMARPGPMPPQQPMAMIQQPPAMPPTMALQQPAMPPMNQQLALQQPAPPSYRPLQPPGMQFFHHQSQ